MPVVRAPVRVRAVASRGIALVAVAVATWLGAALAACGGGSPNGTAPDAATDSPGVGSDEGPSGDAGPAADAGDARADAGDAYSGPGDATAGDAATSDASDAATVGATTPFVSYEA